MLSNFFRFFHFDFWSFIAMVFLLAFSLTAIYSLSLEADKAGFSNFEKQSIFISLGLLFFFIFSYIDYHLWRNWSGGLYLLGIILLFLVLLLGKDIRGTSGWFRLGPFNFQPVELMKIFLIFGLANFFSRQAEGRLSLRTVLISAGYVGLPIFLVLLQPDLGSATVLGVIWLGLLVLARIKWRHFLAILMLVVLVSFSSYGWVLKDYQKERVQSFLHPQRDPLGSGYNVLQSIVAIGSGGLSGKGLGQGSQSQLNFLPEKHNDFIFASMAEESGLIGVSFILGLIILMLWRIKRAMDLAKDNFGKLLAGGVLVLLFFQTISNMGMNLGLIPVTGLSLPLLSYGGSFLLITLISLGIVQNIWKKAV